MSPFATPSPIWTRALVAFAALISTVCTAAELPAVVEKPEVVIGENWTYAAYQNDQKFQIKIEIEELNDTEIRTVFTPNGNAAYAKRQIYDRQWNLVETGDDANGFIKYSPYLPTLHFPLQIGKTWKQNYEWNLREPPETNSPPKTNPQTWKDVQDQKAGKNRTQGGGRVEARVLGWEKITVPAGTFDTIKVELLSPHYAGSETSRIFAKKEMAGGMIQLYWYAPKIRRYIKHLSRLYVNEKLITSTGLDLIEYNETPTSVSTSGKRRGRPIAPQNTESEYLQTLSSGFSLDVSVTPAEILYNIKMKARKSLPEGAIGVLTFDSPDPRVAPAEVVHEFKPYETEISVQSPAVVCIVNGGRYRIVVRVFSDRERRELLGEHEQMVDFSASDDFLKAVRVSDCRSNEKLGSREPRNTP